MNWKRIIFIILALLILIPAGLYFGSLDWSKKHETRVDALPLFSEKATTGEYRLRVNGYEYLIRVAGMKNTGENVILLHGFPESSIMWDALSTRAAQDGYRILAFDQRGYSPKARPTDIQDYHLDKLSADVFAVADAVGFEKFHLVGHDWGAAIGWKAVMDNPQRIQTWTALSIPHTGVFFEGVINDTTQAKRSGYFQLFQKAYLPEFLLTFAGQRNMNKLIAKLPQKQQEEYFSILAEPGALTAALNWYRAMDVKGFAKNRTFMKDITRPTLFIWGTKDVVVSESVIAKQKPFIKAPYQEIKLEAGHALIQEKEKEVIEAILKQWKVR